MKKAFRVILVILIIVIAIAGILALFIRFRGMPVYKAEKITIQVVATPEKIANGKKLASMLCFNCHYNEQTRKFTGRLLNDIPQFGEIYSANITKDSTAGIGRWSDGDLIYFIRTGVKPDGEYIPPYMPKLIHIADEDLHSIIAYLRSDDNYVKADNSRSRKSNPSFLAKFLLTIKAFKPFDYPKDPIPLPDTTNQVTWGKYMTLYQYECYACHSKDFATNDYEFPEKSPGFFEGGNKMYQMDGSAIFTLNITPDRETGIGNWSEDDFVKAVKTGIVPGRQPALRYPMMPYINLTDTELKAIYAFLKTVPPIKNKVERKFMGQQYHM